MSEFLIVSAVPVIGAASAFLLGISVALLLFGVEARLLERATARSPRRVDPTGSRTSR